MSSVVVSVEGLGKLYRVHHAVRHDLLRDRLAYLLKAPARWLRRENKRAIADRDEAFWALKDVSFTVNQGEVVGIVGRNGAGKSTLLKVLSRITEPTVGRVRVRGRVASLLEVGTGFHPELSGRENIFLNGAILGMTRSEIVRKFDEIVAFAEVERFIDHPVKHYSSGMYVRLAFAVAAHLEPEILVVDEVLAVGDLQFQQKCLGKMRSVARSEGRTVLFVSHNTAAVAQLCSSGLFLESGRVAYRGDVGECLARYSSSALRDEGSILSALKGVDPRIEPLDFTIGGTRSRGVWVRSGQTTLELELRLRLNTPLRLSLEVQLKDAYGGSLALFSPGHQDPANGVLALPPGEHRLRAEVGLPPLHRGSYPICVAVTKPGEAYYSPSQQVCTLHHEGTSMAGGVVFDQSAQGAGFMMLPGKIVSG